MTAKLTLGLEGAVAAAKARVGMRHAPPHVQRSATIAHVVFASTLLVQSRPGSSIKAL